MRKALLSFLLLATIAASAQKKTVVYFRTAESTLLPAACATLDSLSASLVNEGKYHLRIDGYCDSNGTHLRNIVLGEKRAVAVYNYLRQHGITADSMTTAGHAESNPAAPGPDSISKARNRRVEILSFLPAPAPPREVKKQPSNPDTDSNKPKTPKEVMRTEALESAPGQATLSSRLDTFPSFANLEVGQKLILKNLNFVNNSAVLLRESIPSIFALLKCMKDNPTLEIKLSGHVCCMPDMDLSIARAKFVYDYLVRKGINPYRMTFEGFSNLFPLLPNDDIDPYAAKVNRRVEITIVNK